MSAGNLAKKITSIREEVRAGTVGTSAELTPQGRLSWFVDLGVCLFAALLWRIGYLFSSKFGIEADEAIVGLMAKHFSEGADYTTFYYGQHYMGSLEAVIMSWLFSLFGGPSNVLLKLTPLFFSLLFVALVYLLGREVFGRAVGLWAGLFAAFSPHVLTVWSTKARGGFIELVFFGTLAIYLMVRSVNFSQLRAKQFFPLGFVLGVAWWVNNQAVYYVFAIGLIALVGVSCLRNFRYATGGFSLGLLGFFAGGAPFWVYNLSPDSWMSTFEFLFSGGGSKTGFADHFSGFITTSLPILVGAKRLWSTSEVAPLLTIPAEILSVAALVGVFVWYGYRVPKAQWEKRLKVVLLGLHPLVVAMVFSLSSFGWLYQAPRYLLPLYSCLFIGEALIVVEMWKRGWMGRIFSGVLTTFVLGLSVFSNITYSDGQFAFRPVGEPFVSSGQRVASSHHELEEYLAREGINHVYTNYWIGYRLAFETNERVTFTVVDKPNVVRIPWYQQKPSERLESSIVYVMVPKQAALFAEKLSKRGYSYHWLEIGEYIIIKDPHFRRDFGQQILGNAMSWSADSRPMWLYRLTDDDVGSRWSSGRPRVEGMSIRVDFDQVYRLTGIELHRGFWSHDAAERMRIIAVGADGSECELYNGGQYGVIAADDFRILLDGYQVKSLIFIADDSHPIFDWSIAEVTLFGAPLADRDK